jgi:hypothetical protein
MSSNTPVWADSTHCSSGLAGKDMDGTTDHLTLRFEVTTKSDAASLNKMREERDIQTQ